MRFIVSTVALSALFPALSFLPAASGITQIPIQKYNGPTTGRYIVQMKDGADRFSRFSLQSRIIQAFDERMITYNWSIINGFAGPFNDAALNIIRTDAQVQSVSEDGIMNISEVQTDAPWGLRRISDRQPLPVGSSPSSLSYDYPYSKNASGNGVDIYIVDTGVRITHYTFQGRARWGATFGGYADADGHGHGTHVAGTAAGFEHGVAKFANVIAVKVLSDEGSGATSDIITGLQWVQGEASASGRPSVVNMSLGGSKSPSMDSAVNSLTTSGVHVAVAAGNSGLPAEAFSPASAPSAFTVAATNITDTRPWWSNWGLSVDIFAPGQDILSAWNTNDTATNQISGTSMATPHITGLIALFISTCGNQTPDDMIKLVQNFSLKGVVREALLVTPNFLAQIPPFNCAD